MASFGIGSRADLTRPPDQDALYGVSDNLAGDTARPTDGRPLKALPGPPLRIAPGGVHCGLETTR
jgi:hypothetical protein